MPPCSTTHSLAARRLVAVDGRLLAASPPAPAPPLAADADATTASVVAQGYRCVMEG